MDHLVVFYDHHLLRVLHDSTWITGQEIFLGFALLLGEKQIILNIAITFFLWLC